MPHLVLLGDSIFDNAAYTSGGPEVVRQVRERLPAGWTATLLAVDGAVVSDLPAQLARLPADATHLVVSAGGNDALGHADLLQRPARATAEVLGWLADAGEAFERRYRTAIDAVRARGLPTTLCTIYHGNFPEPEFQRVAQTALAVFNDAILRTAFARALDVIDLRLVCDRPADYANAIEPSSGGGAKIAAAIVRAACAPVAGGRRGSRIIAGDEGPRPAEPRGRPPQPSP
jgi:lysophospholipase L1-like esterase